LIRISKVYRQFVSLKTINMKTLVKEEYTYVPLTLLIEFCTSFNLLNLTIKEAREIYVEYHKHI